MSVQKVNVLVPPLRDMSPGSAWLGTAVSWLFVAAERLGSRLAASLEAARVRKATDRAARHDARSRMEVMALARRYESTQPEFAKDLYAAARSDRQV
jgi:hypothetical protein